MDQCPKLKLVPCEWVDGWTSVLVWNWYHAKRRSKKLVIIGQDWFAGRWETIEIKKK